jgi:hypothetical protein
MIKSDLTRIEFKLGIRLPVAYRDFILSDSAEDVQMVFATAEEVLLSNQCARLTCWLGRPLPYSIYIFGRSEQNRELFFDLDFPEPPVKTNSCSCGATPVLKAANSLFLSIDFRNRAALALGFMKWIAGSL